jgi:hypothetical protein
MNLNTKKCIKTIAAILGTILIGAIGSGVWQHLLGPAFFFLRDVILNLSSLDIKKIQNNIYIEIGKGFHEGLSKKSFNILNMLYVYVIIYIIVRIILDYRETEKNLQMIQKEQTTSEKPTMKELNNKFKELNNKFKKMGKYNLICLLLATFVICISILDKVQYEYINSAITYYQQMNVINRPYLSQNENLRIESEFAQISSKEDYVKIVNNLKDIALKNKQKVPTFDIW